MSSSAGKKNRESRKSKEKYYHDDGYQERGTPRGANRSAGGGGEGYDSHREPSQDSPNQSGYTNQHLSTWESDATLEQGFNNLSVSSSGSPDSRQNYTTDPPPFGTANTGYATYSTAPSYASSSYATGPNTLSTYNPSGYVEYQSGSRTLEASATTTYPSTYPDAQASAYPISYQPSASTTQYQESSYASSYALRQDSTYPIGQLPSTAQNYYGQAIPYVQQGSDYSQQRSDSHVPKPTAIKQCGCLGCDVDGKPDSRPKLRDGKDEHKKSSRNKNSSKKSESSKRKSVSTSAPFEVRLASAADAQNGNMNCGALYLHDIKPWPQPRPPPPGSSRGDESEYQAELKRWKEDSKLWRDTSCPCRFGYFNTDGHWVAGNYVRKYLKEGPSAIGATPPNPRWKTNGWKAPEQPESEEMD